MKYLSLLLLPLLLLSCNKSDKKEQSFDSFVYSYSAENMSYSIKITNNDTLYFQKRYPEPVTNYYTLVRNASKDSLISLVEKIDFIKYDSIYDDAYVDGLGFKFFIAKKKKTNSIYVHSENAPKDLYTFAAKFNSLVSSFNFQPYTGKVHFGNLKHIELPAPPPIDTTITN